MEVVALVGNGCSISYNPALAMEPLTKQVLSRFAESESTVEEVQHALATLAESSNNDLPGRVAVFEELFGPIERLDRGLVALQRLAQLLDAGTDIGAAFLTTVQFGQELRRRTLGAALDVIADLSTGQGSPAMGPLKRLVEWLTEIAGSGGTTRIFTLNYDALIDGAALDLRDQRAKRTRLPWARGIVLSDMAQGFSEEAVDVIPGGSASAYPLRDDDEYKSASLIIYHLHGSLQWLRREDGSVWKVERLERLRELDFWVRYSRGDTALEPVVVLADQKARAVELDPFRWAYDRFEDALRSADLLVIAGYGFGDLPVNRALARGLEATRYPVRCIDYTEDVGGFKASISLRIAGEEATAKAMAAKLARRLERTLRVSGAGVPAALDDLSWTKT